jgi:hypothetical protein
VEQIGIYRCCVYLVLISDYITVGNVHVYALCGVSGGLSRCVDGWILAMDGHELLSISTDRHGHTFGQHVHIAARTCRWVDCHDVLMRGLS